MNAEYFETGYVEDEYPEPEESDEIPDEPEEVALMQGDWDHAFDEPAPEANPDDLHDAHMDELAAERYRKALRLPEAS